MKAGRSDRAAHSRGADISHLIVIPLNDEIVEGVARAAPWPPPGGLPAGEDPFERVVVEVPEPTTLLLMEKGKAPEPGWRVTPERAVYISVILHLLLVLALVTVKLPERELKPLEEQPDPLGLLALMKAAQPEPPIPVQFFPAPGPKAKAPGPRPLPSDKDRVAHGGDIRFPKSEVPKAVAKAGIRDLEAGKRGEVASTSAADAAREKSLRDLVESPSREAPARPLKGIPSQVLAGLTAQQAEQAAREARGMGGEEGGGFEREGGFVDSGPLSFDTVGYDWGAYAAEMIRKIKRNWDIPALAHYGIKGRLTIRFFILKDGRVEAERILSASGIPPYDNASFQAIARSSPFRPLPADLGHDREGVTITFFYNIRPEDYEQAGGGSRRPADPNGGSN